MIASVEDALRVGQYTHKRAAEVQIARETLAQLTPREQHVLDQLVRGHSNKTAAYALGISTRTVEFHRARIMSKLNARSMTDLLRVALYSRTVRHGCRLRGESPAGSVRRCVSAGPHGGRIQAVISRNNRVLTQNMRSSRSQILFALSTASRFQTLYPASPGSSPNRSRAKLLTRKPQLCGMRERKN